MSRPDPLAEYLDRPVEDAPCAHPLLAIGPDQWLVVEAGMKELTAQGLPPGRVWSDVLRFFAG